MSNLTFRRFTGRSGLESLRPEWEELTAPLGALWFHHLPQWYASYLEAIEVDESSVAFYAGYEGGALRAVFPLKTAEMKVGGVRVRALIVPHHDHMPFTDFVTDSEGRDREHLASLLRYLQQEGNTRWDVISFPRTLARSATANAATGWRPLLVRTARGGSDTLPLMPYDEFSQRLSKNFRGNLRKARNKLNALQDVEFSTARTLDELYAAYEQFLVVEASGWKGTAGQGTAINLHPELREFYRKLIDHFGRSGNCEINRLSVGGECIAAQFCIVVSSVYYVLKIGYDERHAALAPGNMLIEHLLKRLQQEGRAHEVNLVSDASWHESWCPQRVEVFEIILANTTVEGLSAVTSLRARSFAKRYVIPAAAVLQHALLDLWNSVSELGSLMSI